MGRGRNKQRNGQQLHNNDQNAEHGNYRNYQNRNQSHSTKNQNFVPQGQWYMKTDPTDPNAQALPYNSPQVPQRQVNQIDVKTSAPIPAPRHSLNKMHNEDHFAMAAFDSVSAAYENSTITNENGGKNEFSQPLGPNTNRRSEERNENDSSSLSENQSFNANESKGAKKKNANAQNDTILYFCNNCDKCIHKDIISNHSKHSITPLKEGYKEAMKKDLDILEGTRQQMNAILITDQQTNGMLSLWDNFVSDNLKEILKHLNTECLQRISRISTLTKKIEKIELQKQCTTFVEFMEFQRVSKEIIQESDNYISKTEIIPFWLCCNWFKNALGLMLVGGKAIYSTRDGSGDFAPLNLQGDRILVSSFRSSLPTGKEAILLPYDVINNILDKESSCAFMNISYSGKNIGFVYIRVDKETTCGRQFLLLCTGEKGPSYLDNCFFRSCLKGKAGHHIWGGDYSKQDGSGGESVIGKENTNALSIRPKPIVKGLISSRFGYQDRSTIFRIYLSGTDSLSSKSGFAFDCYGFGQVEDGLDNLSHVADMNDITKASIADVGRVFSLV